MRASRNACEIRHARWFCYGLSQYHRTLGADTPQLWVEITSAHFVVVSNAGEQRARDVAYQLEQIRSVYQTILPKSRVDPEQPTVVLAVQNEKDLQELLPQYWERKGQFHPAGLLQKSLDRYYVALRLDVIGPNPYRLVYHEYFHLLNRLNTPEIPVWLDEGLAEFWGNTRIRDGIVEMGFPNSAYLQILRTKELIPLDVLLAVDRSSPYYSEANNTSTFYAQSWALTHYLMIGDGTADGKQKLTNYMNLVQAEHDAVGAARRAFDSLSSLEKELDEYVRNLEFPVFRTEVPAGVDRTAFKVRDLSQSESLAFRGDFLICGERPRNARRILQKALELDPNSAHAHESMGLLCYREKNRDEAARWFEKAVELDSRRFLARYLLAAKRPWTPV